MKLNEKTAYFRKRKGLSQEDLAARIGVSRQSVSKWETGDTQPETSKLLALADAPGVHTDWLLDDSKSDEEPPAAETACSRCRMQPLSKPSDGCGFSGPPRRPFLSCLFYG